MWRWRLVKCRWDCATVKKLLGKRMALLTLMGNCMMLSEVKWRRKLTNCRWD